MLWVGVDVGIAVAGLVALALISLRLYRQVRGFGREVSAAGARLNSLLAELEALRFDSSERR